jgi:hypothetical protein
VTLKSFELNGSKVFITSDGIQFFLEANFASFEPVAFEYYMQADVCFDVLIDEILETQKLH